MAKCGRDACGSVSACLCIMAYIGPYISHKVTTWWVHESDTQLLMKMLNNKSVVWKFVDGINV